ncbi:MAG: hypothetical protein Q9M45_04665 [Robiginitomaculum sp.]|nr:hypothetical protein [Robiginitomaculum sp.]
MPLISGRALSDPGLCASDIDIGMNDWMVDELEWDDARRPIAAQGSLQCRTD